ncbi:hypothetical protein TNCV_3845451 [Trichonephila clavipes]|nr:hypothetical protein TNCV_3845451 [Trichonephila clavipes]
MFRSPEEIWRDCGFPRGHGLELKVAFTYPTCKKTMHVKSVEAHSVQVGVVWKFRQRGEFRKSLILDTACVQLQKKNPVAAFAGFGIQIRKKEPPEVPDFYSRFTAQILLWDRPWLLNRSGKFQIG